MTALVICGIAFFVILFLAYLYCEVFNDEEDK